MKQFNKGFAGTLLITLVLSACGGGGSGQSDIRAMQSGSPPASSSPTPDTSTGPVADEPPQVMSSGVITGFGSVFVNGVEFETGSAHVRTDDEENASEQDLQVGMVVQVVGTINEDGVTGEASDIKYSENLQGLVESVDLSLGTFSILGQTIITDELTNFEGGITLDSMQVGQLVEVSGMLDADGAIVASLVKLEDAQHTELKVEGIVSNLDLENSLFELNGLLVNFALAAIDQAGALVDGAYVRVRSNQDLVDGVMQADRILIRDSGAGEASGEEELEVGMPVVIDGIIDSFESLADFTVNGERALVNDQTDYLNGSSSDDLVLNARVRIKGTLNTDGMIEVEHLTLQTRNFLGMEGEIQSVDLVNHAFTMLGISFLVNEDTHLIDSGPNRIKYFSLADLLVGDWIEVMARETDQETEYVAVKIKRHVEQEAAGIKLSGPISGIDSLLLQFSLNGFVVQVTDSTEIKIEHGSALDIAAMFELLADGLKVKIEGTMEGDMVVAVEISIRQPAGHGKNTGLEQDDASADDDSSKGDDKGEAGDNGKAGEDHGNGKDKDKDKDKDKGEQDDEEDADAGEDAAGEAGS